MKWLLYTIILLAACTGSPTPPKWQTNTARSLERFQQYWLEGQDRIAASEFQNAMSQIAATGNLNLVAQAELIRCAMRVAGIDFSPCEEFRRLELYAGPKETAYFQLLEGSWNGLNPDRIPNQYRRFILAPDMTRRNHAVRRIQDPVSRLIALALLLKKGQIAPETLYLAIETASSQGWRRPLLAWLNILLRQAEAKGDEEAIARLKKQIEIVLGSKP